jgi:hypothetical protein
MIDVANLLTWHRLQGCITWAVLGWNVALRAWPYVSTATSSLAREDALGAHRHQTARQQRAGNDPLQVVGGVDVVFPLFWRPRVLLVDPHTRRPVEQTAPLGQRRAVRHGAALAAPREVTPA